MLEAVLAYRDVRHEREFFFAIFFYKNRKIYSAKLDIQLWTNNKKTYFMRASLNTCCISVYSKNYCYIIASLTEKGQRYWSFSFLFAI